MHRGDTAWVNFSDVDAVGVALDQLPENLDRGVAAGGDGT